ncbi:MAG: YceD family protein [Solirubrobacterales bacterium]
MTETPPTTFDVGRLALSPGEARRLDLAVDPGVFELGGQTYTPTDRPTVARLDVSRTAAGHAFRLRFGTDLEGTCVACLEPARRRVEVDAREVDQPGSDDEELESPYVDGDELLLSDWVRDALVLAMPLRFLCREDCVGLCSVCGKSLNDTDPADHDHGSEPDPRWAKLRELELE